MGRTEDGRGEENRERGREEENRRGDRDGEEEMRGKDWKGKKIDGKGRNRRVGRTGEYSIRYNI